MKVKDLIKELEKLDQELEVGMFKVDDYGDFFADIKVYETSCTKLYKARGDYELIKVDKFCAIY